ncbi:MAG TPA: hypothetical protein VMU94_02625 [Streptosporangiaceae bacterium]|nr:hypothetical protein [Streptosporangiaceae bacterium]
MELGVRPAQLGEFDEGIDGPANSQSIRPAGGPSRATMFHGATSQCPITLAGPPSSRPCHGNQTADPA